jgi:predicted secreted protein
VDSRLHGNDKIIEIFVIGDNRRMQSLRRAHFLARLVLVWFALTIGAAIASPMVNPQSTQLICTGSGVMKVIVTTADGVQEVASQSMDCPLCASMGAPPPVARLAAEPLLPLSYAVQSIPAAVIAKLTAVPPPARGPPDFS